MNTFLSFKVQLSRFTDREIVSTLGRQKISFFNRTGGAIRKTAKRSLRKAPQKKYSELTGDEKKRYAIGVRRFEQGKRKSQPRRPGRTAARGNPPLLHMKKSPLRELLFFSVDQRQEFVIVGPSRLKGGNLFLLEQNFPFMAPALQKIEPSIPQYLAAARSS
jgi:hypothetical protein